MFCCLVITVKSTRSIEGLMDKTLVNKINMVHMLRFISMDVHIDQLGLHENVLYNNQIILPTL